MIAILYKNIAEIVPRNKKNTLNRSPRIKKNKILASQQRKYERQQNESMDSLLILPLGREYSHLKAFEKILFIMVLTNLILPVANAQQSRKENPLTSKDTCKEQSNEITSLPTYYSMVPHDVSATIHDCFPKTSGLSNGKICFFGADRYLLKSVNDVNQYTTHSATLKRIYNSEFIKKTMDVNIPELNLVYEKNGEYTDEYGLLIQEELYSASKFISEKIEIKQEL